MATTVSELQVVVSADTSKAESGLSALGGKLGSVGAGLATAFGAVAVAGIAGVGAALVASTTKFAGFQAQMNVLKVTAGATDDQMSMLSQRARELGADLDLPSTSSAGAATAMLELAKAGLSVDQTMAAAKGTLQLAAAASIDEAKAAQLTAGALNAFGLSGDKATLVANQLAYAANASALDATDLGQAVGQAGFIFKATGRPMEELVSSMIVLGNAGLSGSDGATALKNALMQASNPTAAATATMKQYGISLFDAQGQMKAVPTIIDHLNDRLGGLTDQQRNAALATIFQSDGMKALIPLMGAGGEQLRKYIEELKTTNAANDQAKARAEGLVGAWKGLTSQWETAQETIGSKLAPGIEELVRTVAEGIGDLTPTLAGIGEQVGTALADGVKTAKDTLRQLTDAWRTVKQVFGEGWEPDASIEPIALAAGNAATKLKELRDMLQQAADKAGQMGAWDNFIGGLETIRTEADLARDNLDRIGEALGRLDTLAGGAGTKVNVLAVGIKIVGAAFELWATSIGQVIDTMLSLGRGALDTISMVGNLGKALAALARGDMAAYDQAAKDATASFLDLIGTHKELNDRTAERTKQALAAMRGSAETDMPGLAAAVESNMAAANQSVEGHGSGMQGFLEANMTSMAGSAEVNMGSMTASAETGMQGVSAAVETGMSQSVASVQGQGPLAVAAAEGMGTGMSGALEAAAPQMSAAAEAGASGAVSAVQGQAGAASSAGQSVGAAVGEGIRGGIMGAIGSIASAAANVVYRAIAAARSAAGSADDYDGERAAGGPVSAGRTYLVGESGPELFMPGQSGTIIPNNRLANAVLPYSGGGSSGSVETIRLDVAIGGRVAKQIVVQGYDLAVKHGWTPSGLTG